MYLSLNRASKEAGVSKSTLSEALNNGRLTAHKNDKGHWQIDPASLFQVFPKTAPNAPLEPQPNDLPNTENRIEIARLQAELDAERKRADREAETVAYLQKKLDDADTDRRNAQARLEDLREKIDPIPQSGVSPSNENTSSQGDLKPRGLLSRIFGG